MPPRNSPSPSRKYGKHRIDEETGELILDYRSHYTPPKTPKPYTSVKVPQNQQDPRQNGR